MLFCRRHILQNSTYLYYNINIRKTKLERFLSQKGGICHVKRFFTEDLLEDFTPEGECVLVGLVSVLDDIAQGLRFEGYTVRDIAHLMHLAVDQVESGTLEERKKNLAEEE